MVHLGNGGGGAESCSGAQKWFTLEVGGWGGIGSVLEIVSRVPLKLKKKLRMITH